MTNLTKHNESIEHINENEIEYWEARELQKVLKYTQWRRFEFIINKVKEAGVKNFDKFHNQGGTISEKLSTLDKNLKELSKNSLLKKISFFK